MSEVQHSRKDDHKTSFNSEKENPFSADSIDVSMSANRGFYSKRYMFGIYRTLLRYYTAPFFVLFTLVDFYYAPQHATGWFFLRLLVPAYIWGSFALMARYTVWRRNIRSVIFGLLVIVSAIVSVMIYLTGGAHSPYLPGPLVASVAAVLIFNFPRNQAVFSQLITCIPVSIAMILHGGAEGLPSALTASVFYLGICVVTAIGSAGKDAMNNLWDKAQRQVRHELEVHRRSEFLKDHFPPRLRAEIEAGRLTLKQKTIIPDAVVGFADIIGSTKIANMVDLNTDWLLKERFLSAASLRATECGIVVLNQLGDGFYFLANFGGSKEWEHNLMLFYEKVAADLKQILDSMETDIGTTESGVRFGVARGPVMLGWIGTGAQRYFTALGPDVNLAARLCVQAHPNQLVIASKAGYDMSAALAGRETRTERYESLKGFDYPITAIHVHPAGKPPVAQSA